MTRAARLVDVRAEPRDDAEMLTQVVMGESVSVAEEADGWVRIHAPDQPSSRDVAGYPGWVRAHDLVEDDPLAVARTFLGVPYLWGGMSHVGIDCSGLVHVSFRTIGVSVPRDAFDQADFCVPVPVEQARAGDLYFFARPGERIHHVGFVVAPDAMLHAPETGALVVEESLTPERRASLVLVGRINRSR